MKKLLLPAILAIVLFSCNNKSEETTKDNKITLHTGALNVVNLKDTLIIYESVCRGCAYEGSTFFRIYDSTDNIILQEVITSGNNPSDVAGGNISKKLVLTSTRPGITNFKLFKFNHDQEDSTKFIRYSVEVKN